MLRRAARIPGKGPAPPRRNRGYREGQKGNDFDPAIQSHKGNQTMTSW